MIRALLRALIGCQHPECYRERRDLDGRQVWHFVCVDCGRAWPMLDHVRLRAGSSSEPRDPTSWGG